MTAMQRNIVRHSIKTSINQPRNPTCLPYLLLLSYDTIGLPNEKAASDSADRISLSLDEKLYVAQTS